MLYLLLFCMLCNIHENIINFYASSEKMNWDGVPLTRVLCIINKGHLACGRERWPALFVFSDTSTKWGETMSPTDQWGEKACQWNEVKSNVINGPVCQRDQIRGFNYIQDIAAEVNK